MTIKCGRCGKRFNYEKYDGICPKCSAFNRKEEQSGNSLYGSMADAAYERLHKEYDGSSVDHGAIPGYHGEAQKEMRRSAPAAQAAGTEQSGGTWKGLPVLFIFLLVLVVTCTILLYGFMNKAAADAGRLQEPIWVESYGAGKSFDFSGRHAGGIWAEELIPPGTVEGFPPEESLVAVHISVSAYEDGVSWESFESPYLQVGDVYKRRISEYQVKEYLVGIPLPGREISDMDLFTFSDVDTDGVIYYFAPLHRGPMQLILMEYAEGSFEKQLAGRVEVAVPLDGRMEDGNVE